MIQKGNIASVLALSLGLVATLAFAAVALATHVHPANGGAKKLSFAVVPAFKACTTGTTGTHGSPLAAPSCQTTTSSAESATLTTGAGTSFKSMGSIVIEVFCTDGSMPPCPAAGDQEGVKMIASLTDVRCKASIAGNSNLCPSTNSSGAKDYAGQIQFNTTIRITDHYNTAGSASCSSTTTCSATVVDLPNPITGSCAATPSDATIGGTCNVSTTNTVPPGVPSPRVEGTKANVEFGQVLVNDGGSDGLASTSPNTVFARQGIYIP